MTKLTAAERAVLEHVSNGMPAYDDMLPVVNELIKRGLMYPGRWATDVAGYEPHGITMAGAALIGYDHRLRS